MAPLKKILFKNEEKVEIDFQINKSVIIHWQCTCTKSTTKKRPSAEGKNNSGNLY